ncbi:MAG: hypothetical protein JWO52_5844, partial [Gammaproteobacteria bacterium]|nr:hypothetical protein [Gammaproteobacteria bacterium]
MTQGVLVDDMDAVYIQTCDKAMFWHYDERNLLQNEIVWAGAPTYRKCPAAEILTREECAALLAPLVDRAPVRGIAA